jgi:antiviral helicase SKI2
MLYRGADLIRDIEYVIFDEVHYVNDTERGVVWEEVIIMLPSYVNLIFLSATTPNTIEFSDWIGRTKRKPVHVVKTDYRPVPLSHHLWAGNKLHKVMEGKGGFSESGYKEAAEALIPQSVKDAIKKGGPKAKPPARPTTGSKQLAWQAQGSKQNWVSLVRFLERELLTPTVVFSFSKKKCVEIAHMLRSLDLNTAKERSAVQSFALQTVARLNPGDSSLPQVLMVCEMVARGIGVHHGGLLPILKEMVEILFSRNLIKVLFATETFAMGVNMPARSVVFNSIRKHDGAQFRVLEPGEYTQMAGRAGRRGLDKGTGILCHYVLLSSLRAPYLRLIYTVGTVILCCFGEEPPPQQILKQMLTGQSTRLQSQFRLTYNMILNLLRVEDMSVESMISRSFSEFATQRALTAYEYPQLLARGTRSLAKLEDKFEKNSVLRIGAEDLEVYYDVSRRLSAENAEILAYIEQTEASSFSEVLQPGRVCLVTAARELGCVRAPVMVLRSEAGNALLTSGKSREDRTRYVCVVLLPAGFFFAGDSKRGEKGVVGYVGSALRRHYAIREFTLKDILLVSNRKHKIDPKAVLTDKAGRHAQVVSGDGRSVRDDPFVGMKALGRKSLDRNSVADSAGASKIDQKIDEVIQSLLDAEKIELEGVGLPALDLRPFLKRGSEALSYRQRCSNLEELLVQLRSCDSHRHPSIEKFYVELERKDTLREKVEALRHLLSNESLQLFPDFLQRKAVLQKLGYIDANETVCVKGRVACEVNTCEELIATEIVFEGLLNDLQPEEIAAVLSPLVFQGKGGDEEFNVELPMSLIACCRQMKTVARNLGQLQKEQGLTIDPDDYCDSTLNFGLVHVVYEWAMGVPFKSICDLTDVEEGSIVRCITRLDELCREVRNCARVVGNPTLYRKMEAASTAIKRDIVFAASLYVS